MATKNKLPKRKAISKKLRFEIFRRDNFTCSYCGRSIKDGVILHVDHIIPVAKKGTTIPENLVTSCSDCNLGKSAKLVDSDKVPTATDSVKLLKEKLALQKEQYDQLKEYYKLTKKLDEYDPQHKFINDTLTAELGYSLNTVGMREFIRLYRRISLEDFRDAIEIVYNKFGKPEDFSTQVSMHKYLCGVVVNKYKIATDPSYKDSLEIKNYYRFHPGNRSSYYVEWKMKPYIELLSVEEIKLDIDETFSIYRGAYFKYLLSLLDNRVSELRKS